jgi:NAD(P)-dependent dehydrogenase (short-subunit alcohol dehydrogenase family)
MKLLEGKRALITGATSGIGLETARLFLEEGARVAITGRSATGLDRARAELGGNVVNLEADAADVGRQSFVAAGVRDAFGALDVLFVNAGIVDFRPLDQWDEAGFDRSIALIL